MFFLQLPPFLLFGIYMTFLHPLLFRSSGQERDTYDYEEKEDLIVRKIKRRIEVKYGLYCLLSLIVWIAVIAGIVMVIIRREETGGETKMMRGGSSPQRRWVDPHLPETFFLS